MNLIGGTVVLTSAFLLATTVVAQWAGSAYCPGPDADQAIDDRVLFRRTRTLMIALLIGYFAGLANLLVSAGLPAIAVVNLVIGIGTIAILYDASPERRPGSDH
ncbi:MAG TPA: hypothetical protein VKX96_09990 [Chloroflexota bacterium]|nr:hypothetical protein [Chloroflexota bacterium]